MTGSGGRSSIQRRLGLISEAAAYWIPRLRGCEYISDLILRIAPLRASRRMAASPCVVSILRDACGACHRARIRATRWQAPQDEVSIFHGLLRRMTAKDSDALTVFTTICER